MDTYDLSPLCAAYDTPMYTREMQELLESTVDDYDSDRVLNLDEDETTNFAVYADDTIVIEGGTDVNTVIIDGEIVMKDRKILTVDVEGLYSEIRKQMSQDIHDEQRLYGEKLQLLKPYYQKWYSDWIDREDLEPYYIMNSKI